MELVHDTPAFNMGQEGTCIVHGHGLADTAHQANQCRKTLWQTGIQSGTFVDMGSRGFVVLPFIPFICFSFLNREGQRRGSELAAVLAWSVITQHCRHLQLVQPSILQVHSHCFCFL